MVSKRSGKFGVSDIKKLNKAIIKFGCLKSVAKDLGYSDPNDFYKRVKVLGIKVIPQLFKPKIGPSEKERAYNRQYFKLVTKQKRLEKRNLEIANRPDRFCLNCNLSIKKDAPPRVKYCSDLCRFKYHANKQYPNKSNPIFCKKCKKEIKILNNNLRGTRYCSDTCRPISLIRTNFHRSNKLF